MDEGARRTVSGSRAYVTYYLEYAHTSRGRPRVFRESVRRSVRLRGSCLSSPRVITFFLSLFLDSLPPSLFPSSTRAGTARTPPSSRSPRLLLYPLPPSPPLALRLVLQVTNLPPPLSRSLRQGRKYRVIEAPNDRSRRTFRRELIRLFGAVASARNGTRIYE